MKKLTQILTQGTFAALLMTVVPTVSAQDSRFFRIAGPVITTITSLHPDGTMVWTNAPTNAIFAVQTTTLLGGSSNWLDYIQIPTTNVVNTNRLFDPNPPAGMALVPAGSFTMGSDEYPGYDEQPVHSVYVSAFYMDKYEVTKAKWDEVYTWAITNGYSFEYGAAGKASNHPAQNMTWYDAVKWCNARSEKDGLTPVYCTDAIKNVVYRTGTNDLQADYVIWSGSGYRLPTEAEWEKAARGGASGHRFPWSDSDTIQHARANYYSSTYYAYDTSPTRGYHPTFYDGIIPNNPYTSPVGYFAPNGYGLYDMAGNVWEWCWDWYSSSYYGSSPTTDPRGAASGGYRCLRGGSWDSNAIYLRCAHRDNTLPDYRFIYLGFRCVLSGGSAL